MTWCMCSVDRTPRCCHGTMFSLFTIRISAVEAQCNTACGVQARRAAASGPPDPWMRRLPSCDRPGAPLSTLSTESRGLEPDSKLDDALAPTKNGPVPVGAPAPADQPAAAAPEQQPRPPKCLSDKGVFP